jgi:nitrate/nitrite transporter NarK
VVSLPAFQRLLVARTISSIGNGMAPIALAFGVLALPGATPTSLSIVLAAQAIPVVILLPFGGVIADRVGSARIIWSTDVILSAFVMTTAILLMTGHATVPILAVMGVINIFVAYNFSTDSWVNYKLFGGTGLMIAFMIAQGLYVSRHVEEEDADASPPKA